MTNIFLFQNSHAYLQVICDTLKETVKELREQLRKVEKMELELESKTNWVSFPE